MLIIASMEILWKSLIAFWLSAFLVNYKQINDVLNLKANIYWGGDETNKQFCLSVSLRNQHTVDLIGMEKMISTPQ